VIAHVGGIPIEETLASIMPALLLTFGAASATMRGRLLRARGEASRPRVQRPDGSGHDPQPIRDCPRR
jgi:hypothetical protein